MPQDAGHAFCQCAMTCASEFALAFFHAIKISRYYYHYLTLLSIVFSPAGRCWGVEAEHQQLQRPQQLK